MIEDNTRRTLRQHIIGRMIGGGGKRGMWFRSWHMGTERWTTTDVRLELGRMEKEGLVIADRTVGNAIRWQLTDCGRVSE